MLLRTAKKSLERGKSTAHLVLDSIPNMGDDGETQMLQSEEMEHFAKEFAEMEEVVVPASATATCLTHYSTICMVLALIIKPVY